MVARYNGTVVGASSSMDLVIMGKDQDIVVDGVTYSVCETGIVIIRQMAMRFI